MAAAEQPSLALLVKATFSALSMGELPSKNILATLISKARPILDHVARAAHRCCMHEDRKL